MTREKLVSQLNDIKTKCGDKGSFYPACMGCIADFILADRTKIQENLYDEGYRDGMTCFAWHGKDGLEVGTSGLSLKRALEKRRDNYNYKTFDAYPYVEEQCLNK